MARENQPEDKKPAERPVQGNSSDHQPPQPNTQRRPEPNKANG